MKTRLKVRDLSNKGYSVHQIASQLNISASLVHQMLTRKGYDYKNLPSIRPIPKKKQATKAVYPDINF